MDIEKVKVCLEGSLKNSALRYWKNVRPDVKKTIFETDDKVANIITRAANAFRLEFYGPGK